ncbi:hypothetical protein BDV12DRAFT_189113 [Aspergillus spectabilis]
MARMQCLGNNSTPRQPKVTCELFHKLTVPSWECRWKVKRFRICRLSRSVQNVLLDGLKNAFLEHTEPFQIDRTLLIDVTTHLGQNLLVDFEHQRQCTFINVKIKILVFQLLGLFLHLTTKSHLLTEKAEMRVVAEQAQHDQVGLCFRVPDVFHDLVFTFAWYFLRHKLRAWSDAVAVERILLWHFNPLSDRFLLSRLCIERRPESSRALLIHFGTRCDTVYRHEKQLLRLDLAVQMFDIIKDGYKHLILGHSEGRRVTVLVCTVMNDAVHVKI